MLILSSYVYTKIRNFKGGFPSGVLDYQQILDYVTLFNRRGLSGFEYRDATLLKTIIL